MNIGQEFSTTKKLLVDSECEDKPDIKQFELVEVKDVVKNENKLPAWYKPINVAASPGS